MRKREMKRGKERKESEEGGREKREEGLVVGGRGERHLFDCK